RCVADVADEVAHLRRVVFLLHLELLEFVAREHHDPARLVARQDGPDVLLSERARSARDQDRFAFQHGVQWTSMESSRISASVFSRFPSPLNRTRSTPKAAIRTCGP